MANLQEQLTNLLTIIQQSWDKTFEGIGNVGVSPDQEFSSMGISLGELNKRLITILEVNFSLFLEKDQETFSGTIIEGEIGKAISAATSISEKLTELSGKIESFAGSGGSAQISDGTVIIPIPEGQINLGKHLNQIKNNLDTIAICASLHFPLVKSDGVSDLSQRAQKFQKLGTEASALLEKIKDFEREGEGHSQSTKAVTENIKAHLEEVLSINSKIKSVSEEANQLQNEIQAKVGQIRETATTSEALRTQVEQYKSQFVAFDEQLEKRVKRLEQFDEDTKVAVEKSDELKAEVERLIQRADQMIRGATVAGLSKSLDDTKNEYKEQLTKTQRGFFVAIGIFILLTIPMAMYVIPGPWDGWFAGEGGKPPEIKFSGVLARIILLIPPAWLCNFQSRRYSELFNLYREYSHKTAMAQSVEGFKREAPEYQEEITAATFMEIQRNPSYLGEEKSDPSHAKSPSRFLNYLIQKMEKRLPGEK